MAGELVADMRQMAEVVQAGVVHSDSQIAIQDNMVAAFQNGAALIDQPQEMTTQQLQGKLIDKSVYLLNGSEEDLRQDEQNSMIGYTWGSSMAQAMERTLNKYPKIRSVAFIGVGSDAKILIHSAINHGNQLDKIYGYDLNENNIAMAQEKINTLGLGDKIELHAGNAAEMQIAQADDYMIGLVVEHQTVEQQLAMMTNLVNQAPVGALFHYREINFRHWEAKAKTERGEKLADFVNNVYIPNTTKKVWLDRGAFPPNDTDRRLDDRIYQVTNGSLKHIETIADERLFSWFEGLSSTLSWHSAITGRMIARKGEEAAIRAMEQNPEEAYANLLRTYRGFANYSRALADWKNLMNSMPTPFDSYWVKA